MASLIIQAPGLARLQLGGASTSGQPAAPRLVFAPLRQQQARRPTLTRAASQDERPTTSGAAAAATIAPVSVPFSADATVDQAASAVRRAWRDGVRRQRVQFLLPLIGATDLDDWPGGIRQQFIAAAPMLESLLVELKKEAGLGGRLTPSILDDGDAVGAWTGDALAAVLFPTADTLKQLRSYAEQRPEGLCLMANPQWNGGQVVSDFGFGPWRARNEELVNSFTETYCFRQLRVLGEDVRIVYAYGGKWQVHVEEDNSLPLVWQGDASPAYPELEALLKARPGSKAAMGPIARLQREMEFNTKQ